MICYLIRHGKDDETVRGGWSDAALCDEGINQVKALAREMESISIECIYSSDLVRTKQTADILNEVLNVNIEYLPQFREVNNGCLAGMNNDVATKRYPGLYWSTLKWEEKYPEGESPKEFYDRIFYAWLQFKNDIRNLPYDVMLVTHGGVMNVIQCIENGIPYSNMANPFPVGYAQLVAIELK